jgi:hypothetical protein
MALDTGYLENLPQVVITPNRNSPRHGLGKHGVVGRTMPAEVLQHKTTLGKANAPEGGETGFWGKDGFTFGDLIDLVNPLQHIPVVSTIYRAITGDEIGIGPRLLGGAVLGGIVGFGVSALNAALEYETGSDIGDHALMAMGLVSEEDVSVAENTPAAVPEVVLSHADEQKPLSVPPAAMPSTLDVPRELTEEEAAILLLSQAGASDATLNAPARASQDPRALYMMGAMNNASQRYQQTQMMDALQDMALTMDIDG